MCLIVLAIDQHRDYPLVLLANRDEYYQRPTAALHTWPENPSLLAGRDLQLGGTWAAWQRGGRFAALTNIRRPDALAPGKRSRGELPLRFLHQDGEPEQFARMLHDTRDDYAPFNLLCGTLGRLCYLSSNDLQVHPLEPGVHGLSNAALNTPWPKLEYARNLLVDRLQSSTPLETESLFACVTRTEPYPDELLPDTGIPRDWERTLSPPFIVSADYGTRSTVLLLGDRQGRLMASERSYYPQQGPQLYLQRSYTLAPNS